MQIYVVKSGDTLFEISKKFKIPVEELISSNAIPNPQDLVVGQTIVIPREGFFYFVQRGESLYSISRRFNIPVAELIRINGIQDPFSLAIGTRVFIPSRVKTTVDVAAYIDPKITREDSVAQVDKVGANLTYLNIFSYEVGKDGSITPPPMDQELIAAAYRNNIVPLMVLTNFAEGTFSTEVATILFNNQALQDKVLNDAIAIAKQKGYLGIDFDFEYLGAQNRQGYINFMKNAKAKLSQNNLSISTALAPKLTADQQGVLYEGHDYKALGEIVDFIFFMTYEWGWSGGPPLPVAPINQVRKVMEYAVSVVPREKIMMGIPLYGYDWTLPYVRGGKFAKAISTNEAYELAAKYNVGIQYDDVAQSPYFNYTDENRRRHEVWFEDARSIQAKFNLVKELGLRGFFYWVLAYDFPQNWLLVSDNFNVRKRI